jgi:hypothetical protein
MKLPASARGHSVLLGEPDTQVDFEMRMKCNPEENRMRFTTRLPTDFVRIFHV